MSHFHQVVKIASLQTDSDDNEWTERRVKPSQRGPLQWESPKKISLRTVRKSEIMFGGNYR